MTWTLFGAVIVLGLWNVVLERKFRYLWGRHDALILEHLELRNELNDR